MAEPVVSGVLTRIGDLLIQESNFLYGVSDQVELLQTELKLMQGLLKDADARQDESDILRQWVVETRDLAYDAEDIIVTYALKVASRKEGSVLKRCACILYEGITVHRGGARNFDLGGKVKLSRSESQFKKNSKCYIYVFVH
uniref:Disease resistance N-terminal domain-containing protein n=1 Tax=Quercus lobata TaxID=97700 RepID=A0A7N2RDU8_QUELO